MSAVLLWRSKGAFVSILASLILGLFLLTLPAAGSEHPPRELLADLLEDEETRARLIESLRSAAVDDGLAEPEEQAPTFSRVLANTTQGVAQNLVGQFGEALEALEALGSEETGPDYAALTANAINLLVVIVGTLAVFLLLRRLARPLFNRASRWATTEGPRSRLIRQTIAVLLAATVDILVVILAWLSGYAVALLIVGDTGAIATRETLFLNAFLMVEVFKALIRVVFASRNDGLRLLPMQGEDAAYWNAWLARLTSFIGYGVLLVVPMVNADLSTAVGQIITFIIMLVAFLYALAIIRQNRDSVAGKLRSAAETATSNYMKFSFSLLARSWHWAAIAYFAGLALVTLVRPEDALPVVLRATLQMVLAVGVGVFLSVVLGQLIGNQLHMTDEMKQKFPLLEERLNDFIPTVLKVVRLVILVVVVAFILDAWGLFSLAAWLGSEAGTNFVLKAVTVALILVIAKSIWILLASWIEHRLNPEVGTGEPTPREKTLLTIFRNALMVALIIMTLMIVLAEIGINIGPLIAGAGVLGLAIGFGAQKLVQDIITGVFIQMENAINAGDVVSAGGITGVAEKLTIRSLGLRDLSGTYHVIPFSSVEAVSNFMRDFGFHVGEYGVAYREDTDEVIHHLREAYEELKKDLRSNPDTEHQLLEEELEVHGVTALADSAVNVRVRIKTWPGVQWAVGRAYNRLVKKHFDAAGIEIPFPHTTLYFGQNKDGSAPPAPIRIEQEMPEGQDPIEVDQADTNPKHKGDFDED
ncbi:MAG: mechanosensitive ion channel [Natronospirillum sp.]|uniref:mechanosensitive ion channel domain-containing protein n=1 Tax=Natronospirillum sp. TaxID=2812955 RepID=UPI0025CCFF10|nr:mechanosensitive ion channel domain-containing protein [Natronospirillum sp.]MCH8550470.1 mechanosensitive ion channel [Natronospirillum sp.]